MLGFSQSMILPGLYTWCRVRKGKESQPERHLKVPQQVLCQLPERYTRGATGFALSQPHQHYNTFEKDIKVYLSGRIGVCIKLKLGQVSS